MEGKALVDFKITWLEFYLASRNIAKVCLFTSVHKQHRYTTKRRDENESESESRLYLLIFSHKNYS